MCTLTTYCSSILPPFWAWLLSPAQMLSWCAHRFTYWLFWNPVISFQFLFCTWLARGFFVLPSCGLFSVNLLMKMSANETNHVKNKFEKEKWLYSCHCLLSSCCLLLIAEKIWGLEYSFILHFTCWMTAVACIFLLFPALCPASLDSINHSFLSKQFLQTTVYTSYAGVLPTCQKNRLCFPQNVELEIQRPFTSLTFAITDVIKSHRPNFTKSNQWFWKSWCFHSRSPFLQTGKPAVCQEFMEEKQEKLIW